MTRAFICGCADLTLSPDELLFVRMSAPWGLILFKRNIGDRAQVAALTASFRDAVGRADAPVLIDQEGGRVQRMGPPHWRAYPAAAAFERAHGLSADARLALAQTAARLIAHDLHAVGVSVDCLPVLDVPALGGHPIIGDRAYGADPAMVARYGAAVCRGLLEGGVLPVIKHIPGHGRAGADSHVELPIVDADRASLSLDFAPFRALNQMPLAMTAHVVYRALDPDHPATTSQRVVRDIIRGEIGFTGCLMSDDLSMQALSGSLGERAAACFAAGVDIALHCNGVLDEARAVADASPVLGGEALARAKAALAQLRPPRDFDPVEAAAALHQALAVGV